jgi:TolB-like protein/tetratricopeptide (TPR) repeat protein
VLPFENLSADPAQEYFAHGLTDTLINYLSRIEGLDVRGRTSSFYYKGRDSDLHTIGRRLNVEYILDGSVLKVEDQVRVTPQLIDSTTGSVVWSETYKDRPLADVFSIQDDIVENVARALEIKLRVGLGGWPGMTDNVEAYDAFLRGTSGMMVGGEETLRAIEHLELAVTLDESFSMAWLVLGSAYSALAEFGLSAGRDDFRRAAEAAFARARELTPGSPLVLLAEARRDADRGALRKAGAFFERLPRLVSEYGEDGFVRLETAVFLARVGRIDEATSLLEAAKRIEPLSAEIALFLGQNYAYAEDFDAALVEFDRGLQIEGSVGPLLRGAALRTALSMQDPVEISRRLAATSGDSQWAMTRLLAGFLDQPAEGLAEIRRIETTGLAEDPAALGTLAEWAAYYGDPEYSLSLLRRLPALDGSTILWINLWQPYMHNVRQVPGFKEFARELGLIDYWREYGWSNFCRGVGNDFECE